MRLKMVTRYGNPLMELRYGAFGNKGLLTAQSDRVTVGFERTGMAVVAGRSIVAGLSEILEDQV